MKGFAAGLSFFCLYFLLSTEAKSNGYKVLDQVNRLQQTAQVQKGRSSILANQAGGGAEDCHFSASIGIAPNQFAIVRPNHQIRWQGLSFHSQKAKCTFLHTGLSPPFLSA